MTTVCVFCGSQSGNSAEIVDATANLGTRLAQQNVDVVYGGGNVGLMGTLADAVLEADGKITGIIPRDLVTRELAHMGASRLHVVQSMHERKALMTQLSDGFIALPGGYGTLDELCEILTWRQLGIHDKPIYLLNLGNFFDPLLEFVRRASETGFVAPQSVAFLKVVDGVEQVIEQLDEL